MQPEPTLDQICAQIAATPANPHRRLIAVAGPPASGKSTFSETLASALTTRGIDTVVVPMDGFHLDNRLLDADGTRARKGAPYTFDGDGFVRLIKALQSPDAVVYPLFDRARDIAIAGAGRIPAACSTVVVEGNYLLLDQPPWNDLQYLWTTTIALSPSRAVLCDRLLQRWRDHGMTDADAQAWIETNDMPNADFVMANQTAADITLTETPI